MITPDIILQPFAASASPQDITVPPQTSPTGFVNFADGYTRFYEINLAANNPQAKAVERGIMNYMFNALTKNAMAWQSQGFAPWFNGKVGGYEKGAFVNRLNSGVMTPYRSLVDANASDPLSAPTQWEYQPTAAEAKANIPMPHGGTSGPTAAVIRTAIDVDTLLNGTYEVQTDATAATMPNMPALTGTAKAGMIESIAWTDSAVGGSVIKLQRVTDKAGTIFIRSATNGVHSPWVVQVSNPYLQSGAMLYGVTSGTGSAYALNLAPSPGVITDGMEVRARIHTVGLGAATLNLNGLGAKAIAGTAYSAIKAGTLQPGAVVTFRFQSSTDSWVIMNLVGGYLQGLPARNSDEVPNLGQVTDLLVPKADLNSPALTGNPTAPTPAVGDNDLSLANTAFVAAAIANRGSFIWSANGTFTCPAGVTKGWLTMSGGGGGGAAYFSATSGGAGGGAGGTNTKLQVALVPGQVYAVTIGAGGQGGQAVTANGSPGGATSFGALATAGGGQGGISAGSGGAGGTGNQQGQQGQAYNPSNISNEQGGQGGGSVYGIGGYGGIRSGLQGGQGIGFGGGGGGGCRNVGGSGASGFVVLEFAQ